MPLAGGNSLNTAVNQWEVLKSWLETRDWEVTLQKVEPENGKGGKSRFNVYAKRPGIMSPRLIFNRLHAHLFFFAYGRRNSIYMHLVMHNIEMFLYSLISPLQQSY